MKTLRRMTGTILSSFDWMISQVENHEALVEATLKEVQQAGSRASEQLKSVKLDGQNMRRRLQEMRAAQDLWSERILQTAKIDQKRALECLRRRKRVERELSALEEQERDHARLEKQLCSDLKVVEEKLTTLKQQRNLLRTRQSRAEALRAAQGQDSNLISEIDHILQRWETKVAEYELQGDCAAGQRDEFEHEFVTSEEEGALKEELADLIRQQANGKTEKQE